MKNKKYYNNIDGLLKSNIKLDYTSEQINEIIKCKNNVEYFLEKYVKIINQDDGIVPFKLYDYQKKLCELFHNNKRILSLQTRQSGKTITTCGYILHYIVFNKNKNVAILANKGSTARKILAKIKSMYKILPEWIQVGINEWNKSSVEFGNSCVIEASNTSCDGIRGDSIGLLFLDELAFVEKGLWEEFWKSTYPTISSSKKAKIIISSTPNGLNHYWKFWNDAINFKNGYKFLKVLWNEVPGRDEKWKEETLKELNGDMALFNSEFNCEFLGSAGTLISSYALKNILIYEEPKELTFDDNFKIYKYPEENHNYLLMVDPAAGLGQDYSSIQIIDITEDISEQVAVFKSNIISLREFPFLINKIGIMYNEGIVIGENNLFGEILDDLNYEIDYPNVFYDDKFGIRMTKGLKASGNSFLKRDIEDGNLKIVDFETIQEFSTYIHVKQSYEADVGYHDDLITPLVLFSYFMKNKIWIENWIDENKFNRGNIKKINDDLLPAGFHNDGDNLNNLDGMFEKVNI